MIEAVAGGGGGNGGKYLVELREWRAGGVVFRAGTIVAYKLAANIF